MQVARGSSGQVQEFTVWKVKTPKDANAEKSKENGHWTLSLRKTHFKELMCNASSISMRHCTGYTPDTGSISELPFREGNAVECWAQV